MSDSISETIATGELIDDFLAEYALLLKWKCSTLDKAYVFFIFLFFLNLPLIVKIKKANKEYTKVT